MSLLQSIEAQLPKGVNDFLPEKAARIACIEERIGRVCQAWGFQQVITPLLEYQDVLALGTGSDIQDRAFRLADRYSSRLLAIPPDITPQVARIVATRLKDQPLPHRLCYQGRVLRQAAYQSGRSRELLQAGAELIGLDSPEADAEMVAMAVEVLHGLGLQDFKLDLGHVQVFGGILAGLELPAATTAAIRTAVAHKDLSALRELLQSCDLPAETREELLALPRLFGGPEVLNEARQRIRNPRSQQALENIAQVLEILAIHGVTPHLTVDLGETRGFDYHTGLTFEGFVTGLGEAVCGGGRYDTLTARYGFAAPATGFACNILALLEALADRPDVAASAERDILLFNRLPDRQDALAIARALRCQGYRVARDIIRRDLEESLDYAARTGIRALLVLGGTDGSSDSVQLIRVSDRQARLLSKESLLAGEHDLPAPAGARS